MKKTTNHGESSIPVKNYNFQLVSTFYLGSKKNKTVDPEIWWLDLGSSILGVIWRPIFLGIESGLEPQGMLGT